MEIELEKALEALERPLGGWGGTEGSELAELELTLPQTLAKLVGDPVATTEARFWRMEAALRAANKALRRAHRKHEARRPCCRCKKPAPRGFEWCVECRERTPETRSKSLDTRACRGELCGNLKWNRMVNAKSKFVPPENLVDWGRACTQPGEQK